MSGTKIIEVGMAEIGYAESPPNSNLTKYGEWFGLNGVAWCGIFISWCYYMAGLKLGNIGFSKGFAGCQTAVAYFKKTGEITTKPVPGDIVFFDWNGDGKYVHTGIYKAHFDPKTLATIEGNTSFTNQSNGGQVMERVRLYSQSIFVHPKILDL
jgi:hypothetical protein